MPSFVCGINNGFFFWRGEETLEGGQECSLEQCCNQFETTWDSCDAECKSELLFVPSNFPFKIRCLWKLALILMVKFLCSLRCRCLKSRMTHIQRHSPLRKLFYSCFSFPVLSCGSMRRDNRKPQSLRIIYSTSIFADEREHVRHFLQKKRVIKKFLEVSCCSRVKQRQRNVQKSVLHVRQVTFLLIRPIVAFHRSKA